MRPSPFTDSLDHRFPAKERSQSSRKQPSSFGRGETAKRWVRACSLVTKNKNLRSTRDLLLPRLIPGKIDASQITEQPVEARA
jgi:hypothetical protein